MSNFGKNFKENPLTAFYRPSSYFGGKSAGKPQEDVGLPSGATPQGPLSNLPPNYIFPEGTQRYDPATNTYTFEESAALKQARQTREAKRQEILASLDVTDPARVAQLEQFKQTFFDELIRLTIEPQERAAIQAGRAGTPASELSARLRTEAGTASVFAKERLAQSDRESKLATLSALESGLSRESAAALQRSQLASSNLLEATALQEARSQTLLNAELYRGTQRLQSREARRQRTSDVVGAISSAAVLKAMSGTCVHQDTLIATAQGLRPIREIQVGEQIFSRVDGVVRLVPVLQRSARLEEEIPMAVLRLEFSDGAHLVVSTRHPIQGRPAGAYTCGDTIEHRRIVSAQMRAVGVEAMCDLLPDSASGEYLAHHVWVQSMLKGAAYATA